MQPVPLPAHYFTAGGAAAAADAADSGTQMHPAVLQHLLQQQQLQQQIQLLQLQAAGFGAAPPSLAPPPPYAGAPLIQGAASAMGLPPIGPSARSDSASTSASSSVENTQPSSSPPSCSTTDGSEAVRLHISNIPYKWRDPDLKTMFAVHGEVVEAEVIFNERGSKGFGFVTMANKEGADAAKAAIHGKNFEGRMVEVNPATAKMSGRQKAKVLQATNPIMNPHLQLAMLQQQQMPPPAADPQLALQMLLQQQQLYAANAILAQYQQQQQLQGLQHPVLLQQQQPQLQQWMLQQQPTANAAPSLDIEKYQRRMTEELMKQQQRYRPY